MFASSTLTNGNLGGLTGADSKCQNYADAAQLGGTSWKAWLSNSTQDAKDRIKDQTYVLLYNHLPIANNKADLIDGTALPRAINYDESGIQIMSTVTTWTGTTTAGLVTAGKTCLDWSSSNLFQNSQPGSATETSSRWTTDPANQVQCSTTARMYCFEQRTTPLPTIRTLDNSINNVGQYSSMILGADGLPFIAYYDDSVDDLKSVKCNNADCTNATIKSPDTTGSVGQYASVILASNGLPFIAYSDATGFNLKTAKCLTADCNGKVYSTIPISAAYVDAALGSDGLPVIASYSITSYQLLVTHCNDSACQSVTNTLVEAIGAAGTTDHFTSIAIGTDGFPVIAYRTSSNELKVAKCSTVDCSGSTTKSVISPPSTNIGYYNSMALGSDGYPVIAYYDTGVDNELEVAHCTNPSCSASTITVVDSPVTAVGQYASINIGSDGYPVISYYDSNKGDLKLAKCNNLDCSSVSVATVDRANNIGRYTSVVLDSNSYPVISYFDATNLDLKLARCYSKTCI